MVMSVQDFKSKLQKLPGLEEKHVFDMMEMAGIYTFQDLGMTNNEGWAEFVGQLLPYRLDHYEEDKQDPWRLAPGHFNALDELWKAAAIARREKEKAAKLRVAPYAPLAEAAIKKHDGNFIHLDICSQYANDSSSAGSSPRRVVNRDFPSDIEFDGDSLFANVSLGSANLLG